MSNQPTEIDLQSGYYFSPGFYMNYWKSIIIPNLDPKIVAYDVRLKNHREAWIGAQLAALKTALSGQKFYFALPERDPPDLYIGTFEPVVTPKGRSARNLHQLYVENTRCDESSGEDLLTQILKKNTIANDGHILLVYLQGASKMPDMKSLSKKLSELEQVYMREVIIMVQLRGDERPGLAESFGFVQVYPGFYHIKIDRNDNDAYFTEPNIIRITGRGIQKDPEYMESIKLMQPRIS